MAQETIHATAVVVGETGVLIRGQSGSGKSTLARQILVCARREGRFARLICDDRVKLTCVHGRLLASRIPAIEGLLEMRGLGIMRVPSLAAAVVGLVVDCDIKPQRLPDDCDKAMTFLDIPLRHIAVNGITDAAECVIWLIAQGKCGQV